MYQRHPFPITRSQRVSPEKKQLAVELRREMTPAETRLWKRLKADALGFHFRRQQIIAGFITDFYCVAAKLAIEVDGPVHDDRAIPDKDRDEALAAIGIRTVRFKNAEVEGDLDRVLETIVTACASRT